MQLPLALDVQRFVDRRRLALTLLDLQLAAAAAEQTGLRLPSAVITNRIYAKLTEDPTLKDLDFSSVFSYLDNQLPPGQEGSS